jgi:hypothetical protein
MLRNLKIKEPDYKQLYESRRAKIDSLNKTISGLKGRITRLENELNVKHIEPPQNVVNNEKMPIWFWLLISCFIGTIIGTILGIIFK